MNEEQERGERIGDWRLRTADWGERRELGMWCGEAQGSFRIGIDDRKAKIAKALSVLG